MLLAGVREPPPGGWALNPGGSAFTNRWTEPKSHSTSGGAEIEFVGDRVWTTIIIGADDAEPILGVTASNPSVSKWARARSASSVCRRCG
ncbi:MAG: hypothetical protein KJ057_07310 [Phycisphaerae bacterium]|nr:MAG: hypothetical protein F9K17_08085 [Phycisphaerae bacterium]MBE7457044.1 hypothetical protein [Planctomycetia bacterium]MCK6463598.1 hypothetical protein [Phycisphaerae bacterium]MCL4718266.1 hypothetical protein [Phycisphaerae bacterium]NUQ09989.1 hypothetical protein [Phycisphaerae bacterium]